MNERADLGENQLLAVLLRCGTACMALLILVVASCTMHKDYRAQQVLAAGVDPLSAACALGADQHTCALAAAKAGK